MHIGSQLISSMLFSADTDCFKREKKEQAGKGKKERKEGERGKGKWEKEGDRENVGVLGIVCRGGYRKHTVSIKITYRFSFEFC